MKASIRYPPWTRILFTVVLGLFLSVMFAPVAGAADLAAFCAEHPTHHKCSGGGGGGNEDEFELTITYRFGDCPGDDCAITAELTATGTKHCDELGHCNFKGDISPGAPKFELPYSLMEMLNNDPEGRYWKGTQLRAYECFGTPPQADPNGRGVELARNIDDESWFTAIGAYASDVDGDDRRRYVFYFFSDNCVEPEDCDTDTWEPFSMAGTYEGGVLLRIESPPKLDGKLKSTPCRCTISNDPSCPHGAVPLSITVTEETAD